MKVRTEKMVKWKKSQQRLPLEMQLEGWKDVGDEGSAPTLQSDHGKGDTRG